MSTENASAKKPKHVSNDRPCEGYDKNGPPANAVREAAPYGRKDELEQGIKGGECAPKKHCRKEARRLWRGREPAQEPKECSEYSSVVAAFGDVKIQHSWIEGETDREPNEIDEQCKEDDP